MIEFKDRVAIVTGAGRGLGRSYALELARRGAKVVVNDLGGARDGSSSSSDTAQEVVDAIKSAGGDAIADGGSVSDEQAMTQLVERTMDAFGRIDIVVNNAGILRDKSFAKMTMDDFRAVLDVHLMGSAILTHAVWPIMREAEYGRLVFTTSSSGLYGNFGQANYGAAKLGIIGLMNTLRIEGQKYNIHANAISPSATTRMTEELLPPEASALLGPEKVTPAVIYLCGDKAPTGKIMCAGGGVYSVASIGETQGVYLGEAPSAEDIEGDMDKIAKGEAKELKSAFDQTGKFFQMAAAGKGS